MQIGEAVKPDMTVMVLDGAIGPCGFVRWERDEADERGTQVKLLRLSRAHSRTLPTLAPSSLRSSMATPREEEPSPRSSLPPPSQQSLTNARSASVAATKTPIIFIGTGEHLHDLEKFAPQAFISKMLGMGDMQGLMEQAQEIALANPDRQENMMKKLEKGEFTVRDLKEQMATIMGMCVRCLLSSVRPTDAARSQGTSLKAHLDDPRHVGDDGRRRERRRSEQEDETHRLYLRQHVDVRARLRRDLFSKSSLFDDRLDLRYSDPCSAFRERQGEGGELDGTEGAERTSVARGARERDVGERGGGGTGAASHVLRDGEEGGREVWVVRSRSLMQCVR